MTILNATKLSYSVKSNKQNRTLLNQVSFSLEKGTINTVIGPNGAGKSTLLKIISGDIHASNGFVEFSIVNCSSVDRSSVDNPNSNFAILASSTVNKANLNDRQRFSKSIAVLPQSSNLNFPLPCKEVVGLGRIPHSTGIDIDQKIIKECLTAIDMLSFSERNFLHLSGGEKQRVQLARVLAQIWRQEDSSMPRLLILDEPCQALDLSHQLDLMNTLKALANKGMTILMVSHDINLAVRYSDQLIALSKGELIYAGKPHPFLTDGGIESLLNVKGRLIRDDNNDVLGWMPY